MDNLIIVDTREKGHKKILEYFDEVKQDYITSTLKTADYMLYKDYSILIDRKDSLREMCNNLTGRKKKKDGYLSEHERLVREIEKARELGCERFIFLIQSANIKSIEEVNKWFSPYTKIKGFMLQKIMKTFAEHHDVEFIFATQEEMGQKIIDILNKK